MQTGEMGVIPEKSPLESGPIVVVAHSMPQGLRDALKGRALQRGVSASKYLVALAIDAINREDADDAESKPTRSKTKR